MQLFPTGILKKQQDAFFLFTLDCCFSTFFQQFIVTLYKNLSKTASGKRKAC